MSDTAAAALKRVSQAALIAALVLYAVAIARTAWVTDDAYITLRTLDNALHGYGLRWNVAERVQAFTHPLWLAVLAVPYAPSRSAFASALGSGIALSLAGVAVLAWRYRQDPARVALAVFLLSLSKAYVDFSTSGLENPLTHLTLIAFSIAVLDERLSTRRGLTAGGVLASALALTRPDAVLLVLPALCLAISARRETKRLAWLAVGLAPWLAWEAFSLFYFGALVPNTALAKLASGVPRGELVRQGVRYLADSATRDPITLAAVLAAAGLAIARGRAPARALAAGVGLHLAYVVWIGGDFMTGRFLTPALCVAVVLLAKLAFEPGRLKRLASVAAIAALGLPFARATILSGPNYGDGAPVAVGRHGIADERKFYFAYAGLWNGAAEASRPTTALSFVRAGMDLKAAHATVATLDAIGFAGFIAGPGAHIVDTLALADPFLSRLPMVRHAPPPFAAEGSDWRIGHFQRSVPEGYLATVATGENRIADPALKALWQDVALATRAPLLAPGRAAAIARLLFSPGPLGSRPDYRPTDWNELLAVLPGELDARYRRALSQLGTDRASARADLEGVVAAAPSHGGAIVELAKLDLRDRRIDEALHLLDGYLAERPGAAEALLQRGEAERLSGRLDDAEASYLEAGRRAPNLRPAAWTSAALVRAMRGDRTGAGRLLDAVLATTPGYGPARRAQEAVRAPG